MPATPGVTQDVTIDPAMGFVASTTWDPNVGIEAGRTYTTATAASVKGASSTDTIVLTKGK